MGSGAKPPPPSPWTEGMTHAFETLPQTSHTKLAIMALIPTLYSHIFYSFLHYLNLKTLETVKLDDIWQKGLPFNVEVTTKTKLAILVFLYCGEIMKNFGLFSEQKYRF